MTSFTLEKRRWRGCPRRSWQSTASKRCKLQKTASVISTNDTTTVYSNEVLALSKGQSPNSDYVPRRKNQLNGIFDRHFSRFCERPRRRSSTPRSTSVRSSTHKTCLPDRSPVYPTDPRSSPAGSRFGRFPVLQVGELRESEISACRERQELRPEKRHCTLGCHPPGEVRGTGVFNGMITAYGLFGDR